MTNDYEKCQYCGVPAEQNKQGNWAPACRGCKASLTKMLRSGKYGDTYNKQTKMRLLAARYDWNSHKWIVPDKL